MEHGSVRQTLPRSCMLSRFILADVLLIAISVPALAADIKSTSTGEFLSSLGVTTHMDQGVSGASYLEPLRYLGVRNVRDGARSASQVILIHRQLGIRLDLAGAGDLRSELAIGKTVAASNALLSFEGPNEPNNFPITYNGDTGGGTGSWAPVARFQSALYQAVKSDPDLRGYPVFAVSEAGAETDNVGLQFLEIPSGARTTFPGGTIYADYANCHNYVTSTSKLYGNNQAWGAADPTLNGPWDSLFVEYGITWLKHFRGYTDDQLMTLPRVTTETGWDSVSDIGGEKTQAAVLVNTYLSQFKRGWRYTFIYHMRDGEGGSDHQGLFNSNSTPKLAATFIHNLTTILADDGPVASPGRLNYGIADQPPTVHDLLLQKSSGVFELAIWDENAKGSDNVTLQLGGSHAKVNVYDISMGIRPVQVLTTIESIPLALSNHALIVEIAD